MSLFLYSMKSKILKFWDIFKYYLHRTHSIKIKDNKISIRYDRRDVWVGIFFGEFTNYICFIPCFPITIRKWL